MKIIKIVVPAFAIFFFSGCETVSKMAQVAMETYSSTAPPTTIETASGLKEALNNSVLTSVGLLSQENGFLKDNLVKIAFPEEIIKVDKALRSAGLGKLSDSFIEQMNRGAEKAVAEATPIFKEAIRTMTFEDAMKILLGNENAATQYFENKTTQNLYSAFKPNVKMVLDKYGISESYNSLMSKYNTLPFVTPVNADLPDYVTKQSLKGLFVKMALEEAKIRTDASLRTSALLKRVFGYADQQKQLNQ